MKTFFTAFAFFSALASAWTATTISPANKYAYSANLGWMDARGDTANGAVIGATFCSGNLYAANVGWINLGSGAPTNSSQYQNLSADDFGVNVDGFGNLRGYAYGANIGWIAFENNGGPVVNFVSGNLSGYAWGANVGWISLSNSIAYIQTAPFVPANDLCAGAVALTNGVSFTMNTANATSTGDPTPGCAAKFGKGVWFIYTAPASGDVIASTCGSDFDTVLTVYSGTCGALMEVACNDDNGPSCAGTSASMRFSATAGATYHILAGGYNSYSGNLSIVATSSPANDQCAGAVVLTNGVPFTMNTTNATSTGDPTPSCAAKFGKGVWFIYTAPASSDVIASTCGSDFDTVLTVYSGTCGALREVACNDDNGPSCAGTSASMRFSATAGATYYLLASGFGSSSGNLSLVASIAPRLTIGQSAGNVTLTWSGNGMLQFATNLTPIVSWTDVTNGGGQWSERMTNAAKFFRIVK